METNIINQRLDEDYIERTITKEANRIYSAVLKAAWKKDEALNEYEINLLDVLRNELDISKRDHYLLESRIGRFPQNDNTLHTHQHMRRSLINLQTRGLVLRIREDTSNYVISIDIAMILRCEMGGELSNEVYQSLLSDLSVTQLREILNQLDINVSGVKEEVVNRIIKHNILPSKALDCFSSKELSDILRTLEGVKISGTKK